MTETAHAPLEAFAISQLRRFFGYLAARTGASDNLESPVQPLPKGRGKGK